MADSALVAAVLLAATDYDFRVVDGTAGSFFLYNADEAKVIEKAGDAFSATSLDNEAEKAYEVARRTAFAAHAAAGAAYDARNARLASRTYEVARRTADQTAATARRAADQAAAAASRQVAAAATIRRAATAADSLQAIAEALPVEVTAQADNDKVARLRRAHDKNAATQAATRLASAVADSLQAAAEAVQTAAASRRAAKAATKSRQSFVAESARLRRAYNKDTVQAAYDVAYSTAYVAAYDASRADYCRAAQYALLQVLYGTAYADTTSIFFENLCGAYRSIVATRERNQAARQAARYAYATYVDSAAIDAGYAAAKALFNAAYDADAADPQAYAAQAYAARAKADAKVEATRYDTAYVTPPISTAVTALAASKAAYQAYATYIDSVLNSIE